MPPPKSEATGSLQSDREHRESAGFGVAYTLGGRTVLVSDLAFGLSGIDAVRNQNGNGMMLQNGSAGNHFESLHLAVQRQIASRFFVLASFVNVWQGSSLRYSVFPDSSGDAQPVSDSLFSTSPSSYLSPRHLSFSCSSAPTIAAFSRTPLSRRRLRPARARCIVPPVRPPRRTQPPRALMPSTSSKTCPTSARA